MDAVTILSALAEPTRLGAVRLLADGGEHCVCELMAQLDATQSRMSRHMQVLRQAGLVIDRRDAQWVRYRLNPGMSREIRTVVESVMTIASGMNGQHQEELAA